MNGRLILDAFTRLHLQPKLNRHADLRIPSTSITFLFPASLDVLVPYRPCLPSRSTTVSEGLYRHSHPLALTCSRADSIVDPRHYHTLIGTLQVKSSSVHQVCMDYYKDYLFKVLCFSANSTIFFSTNIPFLFLTSST